MAKASMKQVEALHALLANYYSELLESGEELSSGTLAAINTFLKNNDVKIDVAESNPLQSLSSKIKELVEAGDDAWH
ncbi:DNA maturase A [Roseobacter phage CRP-143]|nr:DNA maturase A [Roseobacter phage CRP-143]